MPHVPSKLPRYRDLPAVPGNPPKTAWGLFGENDNVGMFNLQTPEVVVTVTTVSTTSSRRRRVSGTDSRTSVTTSTASGAV